MTVDELRDILDTLIADWESEVVEFKRAQGNFSTQDIGKYFSALANEANLRGHARGWLVFGVHDKTRKVVGSTYRPERERLDGIKHDVANGIAPRMTFREVHELVLDTGRVVMFEVPAAPRGLPVSWNGHCYAREGESLAALADDKRDEIRGQSVDEDWTAVVVSEATLEDLDGDALSAARAAFLAKHGERLDADDVAGWSDATFLQKCRLLTPGGGLTRAALLLLGKPAAAVHLAPHMAQLTWKLVGQETAYEHFDPPFLLATTRLYRRIRNVEIPIQPEGRMAQVRLAKYDEAIVLEALNNCIAHQDYRRHARVLVTEHPHELTFESEGRFFDGRPEDYATGDRTPRRYRNTTLVNGMVALNMIDTMGTGIGKMVRGQVRRHLPLPDHDIADEPERVKLTLHGRVIDPAYSRMLIARTDLPLPDVIALDRVQKRLPIEKADAARLRKAGLVEGRYPNLHVSAGLARLTGQQAEVITNRRQDDEFLGKLVMDYLAQYESATRPAIDELLRQKVGGGSLTASQVTRRIANVLTKMREAGRIEVDRPGRGGIWTLAESNKDHEVGSEWTVREASGPAGSRKNAGSR